MKGHGDDAPWEDEDGMTEKRGSRRWGSILCWPATIKSGVLTTQWNPRGSTSHRSAAVWCFWCFGAQPQLFPSLRLRRSGPAGGRGGGLTGAAPFGARVSHEATVFSTPRLAEHETKKECPQGPSGRHLLARLRSVHLGVLKVRFSGGETVLEWYFGKSNGVALLRGNQPCRILQWDWRSPRSGLPGLPGFCPWTLTVWYIDGKHRGVFYERVANCHRVSRESHRRRKQVKSLQAWAVALADAPPICWRL